MVRCYPRRTVLPLLVLPALASLPWPTARAQATAPARPFDPVGRWRFLHTDGSTFIGRLAPDQTASTDFGGGEHGIWRWEGNGVRSLYTDGWDDLLTLTGDGTFIKAGWSPDADRCGPPSNRTRATRISPDPGAPL